MCKFVAACGISASPEFAVGSQCLEVSTQCVAALPVSISMPFLWEAKL